MDDRTPCIAHNRGRETTAAAIVIVLDGQNDIPGIARRRLHPDYNLDPGELFKAMRLVRDGGDWMARSRFYSSGGSGDIGTPSIGG